MFFGRKSSSKKKRNRKKNVRRQPILMVSARRKEKQRGRISRISVVVLLTCVLGGAGWVTFITTRTLGRLLFTQNSRYMIRHLELSSDVKLQPWHIKEYAHLNDQQNLFALNIRKVRDDLLSVPIVKAVTVTRELPDTLRVQVTERAPVAQLGYNGLGYPLAIDDEGYILGPSSINPSLPVIDGIQEKGLRPGVVIADDHLYEALDVLTICGRADLSRMIRIKKIDVSHADYMVLVLEDGERVYLSESNRDPKLFQLAKIISTSRNRNERIKAVDMTVDKNFPVEHY